MLEILTLIVNTLTFFAVIASVWYVIRQIKKEHEWNRRKSAQDLADRLMQGELAETRRKLEHVAKWYDFAHTYANVTDVEDKADLHHHIKNYLNFFEAIALGVKHGIYDEDIAFEYFGSVLPEVSRWSMPYINERRNLANDATIYIEIEAVAERWRERNEAHQRKVEEAARTPGKSAL
ncbi:MAG: DUF4760 domain-containing protein [Desulfobacterales bacterium]|nr:DUF4760 domain-containing protein [Desulfobacterales bacterium]